MIFYDKTFVFQCCGGTRHERGHIARSLDKVRKREAPLPLLPPLHCSSALQRSSSPVYLTASMPRSGSSRLTPLGPGARDPDCEVLPSERCSPPSQFTPYLSSGSRAGLGSALRFRHPLPLSPLPPSSQRIERHLKIVLKEQVRIPEIL